MKKNHINKPISTKPTILLLFATVLIGGALVYTSSHYNWVRENHDLVTLNPNFSNQTDEVVYGDIYMLDEKMKWHTLPPMPKPDSHIEASWILLNNSIVIAGGTTEKTSVTKRMILVGELFQFDLNSKKWHVIGKLPYRVKTMQAAYWNGWFYITSGQRDKGPDNHNRRKFQS